MLDLFYRKLKIYRNSHAFLIKTRMRFSQMKPAYILDKNLKCMSLTYMLISQ